MVIASHAFGIVNRVGEVQREMAADNRQLRGVSVVWASCFHQKSLYQLHSWETAGYVSSMSSFTGNNTKVGWQ
jgi:hypothetical protein